MNFERLRVTINGVERPVVYDPEKDTLSTVLRRMGLTGVKVGCGVGVCGACSILYNGEVIRSCTKKMKTVTEFAEIYTIEALGTAANLHPLQQAWITYGGVQCGFCTPGFIMSAYGLLLKNPNPTREEVREWFRVHKNVCRCTGYKPIVDAVMAAAAVMRGEKTMADITYDFEGEKDIYGSRHPRPAALAKVLGLADYGNDIELKAPEGMVHLAVVLSDAIHAKIISIDTSEAEKMPGVIRVFTAKDVPGGNDLEGPAIVPRQKGKGYTKFPIICGEKVCRKGDVVALVAADTREHAREAAKMVKQNLEPLPAYTTLPEAAAPNAVRLFEEIPNFYMEQPVFKGEDPEDVFEDADHVVGGSFHSQHEPHLPIESDSIISYFDPDGMLTLQCKVQALTECTDTIALGLSYPKENIRMIMNPTGGAFGYAITPGTYVLCAMATILLNCPCSLSLSWDEFNHMTGKRSATYTNGKLAVSDDGKILAAEYDCGLDHGAYAVVAGKIFNNLVSVGFHGYDIPNFKGLVRGVATNHAFNTAYRGFGAPQIYTTTEALIDMAAEEIGMDPWEFRYKNCAREGATTINSRPYKAYPYPKLLEMIKPYYDEYKALAEKGKAEGKAMGVGVSLGGFLCTIGFIDSSNCAIELMPDGTITNYNTWEDVGQGGDIGALTHTVKALEPLGIKADQVHLVMNELPKCPDSGISAASRQHYMTGNAIIDGCNKLMDAMRKPDGSFRTYDEMVAEGIPTRYEGHYDQFGLGLPPGLDPNTGEGDKDAEFMYGCNTCLVEVDKATGKTTVLKYTCAADVGVIGNKLAVDGQAYGGLSHSIGFALSETYEQDKKHNTIAGCGVPTIDAIPDDFNVLYYERPRERGPQGSAGCSECFQSSGHMAVINAINNAVGVRIFALPATPEKVKAAIEKKERGEDLTPEQYWLGSDFNEELDYIKANPL
ncbi:MAG: molybdopterin-dependent oxidoreductase [Oscillospiraceae bacterium]|nr:molybdopterin-dependent oxidoreductase [Oscillospiraceae bacterium]